jgi:decaprenylphospho-beta-D-erythro-pentofuranosid-2-ulose 2-reductase
MKNILIVGASSAIAIACARIWVEAQARFFLVARDPEKLAQVAADLQARGATEVVAHPLEMNDLEAHEAMLSSAFAHLGKLDICLIAYGTLPDQGACQLDTGLALREFANNGLSAIALLTRLANRMERQGSGHVAVISSVAGDRGRPSNYLYGSAKAALSTFCEGLRARLFKAGVHLLTVKPGFVDTPMTQGLKLPKALLSSPDRVAADICSAIDKRRTSIYTPWFWFALMLVVRNIPGALFRRLSL